MNNTPTMIATPHEVRTASETYRYKIVKEEINDILYRSPPDKKIRIDMNTYYYWAGFLINDLKEAGWKVDESDVMFVGDYGSGMLYLEFPDG